MDLFLDTPYNNFASLVGKTIIEIKGMEIDSEEIIFKFLDGDIYQMYHESDCCEQVYLAEVWGNVKDLINTPIIKADEWIHAKDGDYEGTEEYTFYNIYTVKGVVTLRWCGLAYGPYSLAVDLIDITEKLH